MIGKKGTQKGFTLIEVLLFLAVSTLIVVALMAGVSQSVTRQRYQDSVQSLNEFLRLQYNEVITTDNSRDPSDLTCSKYYHARSALLANKSTIFPDGLSVNPPPITPPSDTGDPDDVVDGWGRGRSQCAIYGKLIIFGQGNKTTPLVPGDPNVVKVFDVIGTDLTYLIEENDYGHGDYDITSQIYNDIDSYLLTVPVLLDGSCGMGTYITQSEYRLEWNARVERPADHMPLQAAMFIVRSPLSGTVHTMIAMEDGDHFINRISNSLVANDDDSACSFVGAGGFTLWQAINDKLSFEQGLDICVGSDDTFARALRRRMIRIAPDGRNATAVELMQADSVGNLCQ
jgi:type II secretory pathway pseudopilin PulG